MKLITYILLFTSLNAFSNDADSLFAIGNYHYDNEAYQKAIESYFAIESDEHASAVYHNLGNSYYQKGDIPNSILFYERALLLKNDLQTQENLKLAKKRIQEIESIPILFPIHWWNSISQLLHTKHWMILSSVFVWISCLLLFLFFKNRQKATFNLFLTAVFFTILLSLVSHRSNHLGKKTYGIILKNTPFFSDITDSKTSVTVTAGNKIEIIDNNYEEYSFITLQNGESGWVSQSDIEGI
ncbi:MAG: hypothetical protein CMP66_05165 [Flavobacteriales bacterium]|nr:hypothetical protein [Flavobacteriales bacterium]